MKNEIHTKENLYHQSNQANSNNTMLNHNDQAYKAGKTIALIRSNNQIMGKTKISKKILIK